MEIFSYLLKLFVVSLRRWRASPADCPLQMLALDRDVSVALSEEVMGPVATAVALVARDREDHASVSVVVSYGFLETVAELREIFVRAQSGLD